MNIATFSPVLALLYVFALLCILMGADLKSFNRTQRWLVPLLLILLCVVNQLLRQWLGYAVYGKLLLFCMHLPTFLLFLYITKCGVIKTLFMILTAIVFTAPTVLIGNLVRRTLFEGQPIALLLANLVSYSLMLLLAYFVFRKTFNYLLLYADNQFFLLFSLVPFAYYLYVLASVNLDLSSLSSVAGNVVRFVPTLLILLFYFLLPYIYQSLRERFSMISTQASLQQKLDSTQDQIALLNEAHSRMAVYRHDMRHQIILLDGLLANGNIEQARKFVQTTMTDLDSFTPKRFCENEMINLLCSSYDSKARRLGVQMKINALLPKDLPLSDTELCPVVSNGLENAVRAASQTELAEKWVTFNCHVKQNKLFIQIQNPYAGQVVFRNGLPIATQEGHGYGCQSIQTIVQRNGGHCSFKAENGLFTLRVALSLPAARNGNLP